MSWGPASLAGLAQNVSATTMMSFHSSRGCARIARASNFLSVLRLLAAPTFYTFWKGTTAMKVPIDKLVLVIGGTGAQGQAVVKALLEPTSDREPSPYAVRILT